MSTPENNKSCMKTTLKFQVNGQTVSPKEFHAKLNDLYVSHKKYDLRGLTDLILANVTTREFASVVLYWFNKAIKEGKNVTLQMFLRMTFGIEKKPQACTSFCAATELCKLLSGVGEYDQKMEDATRYLPPNKGVDGLIDMIQKMLAKETCVLYLIMSRS